MHTIWTTLKKFFGRLSLNIFHFPSHFLYTLNSEKILWYRSQFHFYVGDDEIIFFILGYNELECVLNGDVFPTTFMYLVEMYEKGTELE